MSRSHPQPHSSDCKAMRIHSVALYMRIGRQHLAVEWLSAIMNPVRKEFWASSCLCVMFVWFCPVWLWGLCIKSYIKEPRILSSSPLWNLGLLNSLGHNGSRLPYDLILLHMSLKYCRSPPFVTQQLSVHSFWQSDARVMAKTLAMDLGSKRRPVNADRLLWQLCATF